jgi:hypothetical protein
MIIDVFAGTNRRNSCPERGMNGRSTRRIFLEFTVAGFRR